jgi:hypothetical protein
VNEVNANPVKAVIIMRGESRRINRACVSRPFSASIQQLGRLFGLSNYLPKMIKQAPITAVVVLHPTAFRVKNIVGTSRMPQIAGSILIATYGTPGSR